jgi:hypothetical protein
MSALWNLSELSNTQMSQLTTSSAICGNAANWRTSEFFGTASTFVSLDFYSDVDYDNRWACP